MTRHAHNSTFNTRSIFLLTGVTVATEAPTVVGGLSKQKESDKSTAPTPLRIHTLLYLFLCKLGILTRVTQVHKLTLLNRPEGDIFFHTDALVRHKPNPPKTILAFASAGDTQ